MTGTPNRSFRIVENYDNLNWQEILPELLPILVAYAHFLIGNSTLGLSKNRTELAKDFAMETIKKHLENPEKFNPERGKDLVKYLKLYILRRLVSNYKSLGSQKNELLFEEGGGTFNEVKKSFISENKIYEQMDYESAIKSIETALVDKSLLAEVFNLRIKSEFTPSEICKKLEISKPEYNNRFRRLKTVMRSVMEQLNNTYGQ